uniref:Uncharacterized protein n=1 Tax=viral metagenome TaxID=1070528 RepID=A0A6M3JNL0_9ZZZZ
MKREDLEKRAKELVVEFDETTTDDELAKLIKDVEDLDTTDTATIKKQLEDAIKRRDTALRDRRDMKKKLDTLQSDLEGRPSKEEYTTLKEQIDSLTTFKKQIEEEIETKKLESLDEVAKAKLRADKAEKEKDVKYQEGLNTATTKFQAQVDELTTKLTGYEKQVGMLRTTSLENEIIKAAVKHKAIEPSHIVKMLRNEFTFDADVGRFFNYVRDEKGNIAKEVEVDEYITDFLAKEENDYLISENVNRTSLRFQDTNKDKDIRVNLSKNTKYDPKSPTVVDAAADAGLSVPDWIEVRQLRDAKFAKIESAKEAK